MSRRAMLMITVLALFGGLAIFLTSCAVSQPVRGPGVSGFANREGATIWVAVTHATLRSEGRKKFMAHSRRVEQSLETQDGFIGYSLRMVPLGDEVWTLTAWRDEAALDAFVDDTVHRAAMDRAMPAMAAARFTRFEIGATEWPVSWDEAIERLDAQYAPFEEDQ